MSIENEPVEFDQECFAEICEALKDKTVAVRVDRLLGVDITPVNAPVDSGKLDLTFDISDVEKHRRSTFHSMRGH